MRLLHRSASYAFGAGLGAGLGVLQKGHTRGGVEVLEILVGRDPIAACVACTPLASPWRSIDRTRITPAPLRYMLYKAT